MSSFNLASITAKENIVLVDFDECLVQGHASRGFTERALAHVDEELLENVSTAGIGELLDLYKGGNRQSFSILTESIAKDFPLRDGAEDFLKILLSSPKITPVIVSCGLDFIISKILTRAGLLVEIVSSSLLFDGQVCLGRDKVVSVEEKGLVAHWFLAQPAVSQVIAIGHNGGDVEMLKAAHRSIALEPASEEARNVASKVVEDTHSALKIVQSWVAK